MRGCSISRKPGQPLALKVRSIGRVTVFDVSETVVQRARASGLEVLIVSRGDGLRRIAQERRTP